MPAGSTPSAVNWASPQGITPSPHALSMGSSRGSATITESPCRPACNAGASPPGPPPTMSRSGSQLVTCNPSSRVTQYGVLYPDAHTEQDRVGDRETSGGQPRGVYQREREPLGHHGNVVRVV